MEAALLKRRSTAFILLPGSPPLSPRFGKRRPTDATDTTDTPFGPVQVARGARVLITGVRKDAGRDESGAAQDEEGPGRS